MRRSRRALSPRWPPRWEREATLLARNLRAAYLAFMRALERARWTRFAKLSFWTAVLGLIIWPYYLGAAVR